MIVAVTLLSGARATAADYEWTFNGGDLSTSLGGGTLSYADAATPGLTSFQTTDGTAVPHIGGQPAAFMRVPGFTDPANGYLISLDASGPNGGGAYINQYTFIADLYSPGAANWQAIFNTAPANGNDADFYVADDGALGIGALAYSPPGTIQQDTWYRIGFAADLGAGVVKYYVNGQVVATRTGGSLLDGRFALYSNVDAGPDVLLFNEGDGSGVYTHELLVNSLVWSDRTFSDVEMLALGAPNAAGILVPEPSAWILGGLGLLVFLLYRRRN
jgi:hypothetical protein